MVKCFLCCKRGGAMKPTNVFKSYEKYAEHRTKQQLKRQARKKGEVTLEAIPDKVQVTDWQSFRQSIIQRLENNASLGELFKREENYKYSTYPDEDEIKKEDPASVTDEMRRLRQIKEYQDEMKLDFTELELKKHCIP